MPNGSSRTPTPTMGDTKLPYKLPTMGDTKLPYKLQFLIFVSYRKKLPEV